MAANGINGLLTVCYYDNGDGTASQSGWAADSTGKYFDTGVVPGYPAHIAVRQIPQWQQKGLLLHLTQRGAISNTTTKNQAKGMEYGNGKGINPNNPIVPARTVGNEIDLVRIDAPSLVQDNLTWRVILDNRAGAGTLRGIIGDPTNIIKRQLKLPAPPVGAIETGTFGIATLQQIQDFIKKGNSYCYNFQGKASANLGLDAADLWSFAPFKEANSDLQGSVTSREMDFESMQDGNQYNEKYRRKEDWKYLFANLNGILYEIPAGYMVIVNLIVKSYAEAELQSLVK